VIRNSFVATTGMMSSPAVRTDSPAVRTDIEKIADHSDDVNEVSAVSEMSSDPTMASSVEVDDVQ
jgi:hypothetical protein